MGTFVRKTYFCDVCLKSFSNEQSIIKTVLPIRRYTEDGTSYVRSTSEFALCGKCWEKYWDACDFHFCTIEEGYRTIDFTPHFNELEAHVLKYTK